MMTWTLAIFLIVGLVCGLLSHIARCRSFARFAKRRCAGRQWVRAFPDASEDEIRQFLGIFADAFSVERKYLLNFLPDDSVMDIYRALNPPRWTVADHLELESFALELGKHYGLDLLSSWRDDMTLGEIFANAR